MLDTGCSYYFGIKTIAVTAPPADQNDFTDKKREERRAEFRAKKGPTFALFTQNSGYYRLAGVSRILVFVESGKFVMLLRYRKCSTKRYIIVVSSNTTLSLALSRLRDSVLWNYRGYHFIVIANLNTGCPMVRDFLHLVWSFNILRAMVICTNLKGQLQFYNSNPYNNFAAAFWSRVDGRDFLNRHIWTLFEKTFEDLNFFQREHQGKLPFDILQKRTIRGASVNVDFDEMNNLFGYTVRMGLGFKEYRSIVVDPSQAR
ncbi:hypothetical protein TSAR_002564 [Trichomalopsis sarcophagae]|uniref:Uncharacterized protein n=1 Tax=Trichomalopsis sarcophagae TaxID=543379 RepID=A0A232F2E5_9HYME|nr:hypothetical protein TSAR_002564 [Trichomalopsis sarcophagae]